MLCYRGGVPLEDHHIFATHAENGYGDCSQFNCCRLCKNCHDEFGDVHSVENHKKILKVNLQYLKNKMYVAKEPDYKLASVHTEIFQEILSRT